MPDSSVSIKVVNSISELNRMNGIDVRYIIQMMALIKLKIHSQAMIF